MINPSSDPFKRLVDLTVGELEVLIFNSIKNNLLVQERDGPDKAKKEFYSPKQFSFQTGVPYSTVVYRCNMGLIKARQDSPKGSWQIVATELDRYKKEASDNIK